MILWTFVEAQITHIEVKFSPIWQIFLPLYHQLSKRASYFISILGNLASTKVHKAIFTSEMFVTFFNLNTASQHQWMILCFLKTWGYKKQKVSSYKENASFFGNFCGLKLKNQYKTRYEQGKSFQVCAIWQGLTTNSSPKLRTFLKQLRSALLLAM